jgi:hypothetical protein
MLWAKLIETFRLIAIEQYAHENSLALLISALFEWFSHYDTNDTGLLRTDPSLRVGMTT